MKRTLPLAAVAALLSSLAAEPPPPGDGEEKSDGPSVGEKAPAFKLRRLDSDGVVRLRDLRGKPTVLIFGSYT